MPARPGAPTRRRRWPAVTGSSGATPNNTAARARAHGGPGETRDQARRRDPASRVPRQDGARRAGSPLAPSGSPSRPAAVLRRTSKSRTSFAPDGTVSTSVTSERSRRWSTRWFAAAPPPSRRNRNASTATTRRAPTRSMMSTFARSNRNGSAPPRGEGQNDERTSPVERADEALHCGGPGDRRSRGGRDRRGQRQARTPGRTTRPIASRLPARQRLPATDPGARRFRSRQVVERSASPTTSASLI